MKFAKALRSDNKDNKSTNATAKGTRVGANVVVENPYYNPLVYVLAGLNALTFNLVFRKLKLTDIDIQNNYALRNALSRTLLYNVTLREVDFNSSNLTGLGESIGNAWAMNGKYPVFKLVIWLRLSFS
ncbi:MAG: hypothetical protein ACI90V_010363 [Bacillariaceae sp.]|jgi:hypothetical protein